VLIGYFSSSPDGFQVAAYAAQQAERLKFLLAHRPGFVAPTLAARQLATLDQFIDGRLAVHIITGGAEHEQARDGDFLDKAARYARTSDYLDVLKKTWTSTQPFNHDGPYYKVVDSYAAVKPAQSPHLPVYFGGSSDEAIDVAGRHADVYAFWGETLEQTRETIAKVRASAARFGRAERIRFSFSLRPILARTEQEAWARADRILEAAKASGVGRRSSIFRKAGEGPQNVAALAGGRSRRQGTGQALVDRNRRAHRRQRQLDRLGGDCRAGCRVAARLLGPRRNDLLDSRLRPARGRDRVRPRADSARSPGD
jgi:alkanesulfonate monooxygenase